MRHESCRGGGVVSVLIAERAREFGLLDPDAWDMAGQRNREQCKRADPAADRKPQTEVGEEVPGIPGA